MNYITRSNEQWICDLTGETGEAAQSDAYENLYRYLYIVAYNKLRNARTVDARLSSLPFSEIEYHAEDFAQDTLLKLTEENYARLKQFRGEGSFASWTAQIINNRIQDVMRSNAWRKSVRQTDDNLNVSLDDTSHEPEKHAINSLLQDRINTYLSQLTPNSRNAFIRCVVNGERKAQVAKDLGISMNALYIQLSRSRQHLRENLREEKLIPNCR